MFKCRSLRKAHKIQQEIEKKNKNVRFQSSQKKIHRIKNCLLGKAILSPASAKILDGTKLLCVINPRLAHSFAFSITEGTQCRVYSLPHQSRNVPPSAAFFFSLPYTAGTTHVPYFYSFGRHLVTMVVGFHWPCQLPSFQHCTGSTFQAFPGAG